jgi:phosphate uptake regulator
MFREILHGPETGPLLRQAYIDVEKMLSTNETMFDAVLTAYLEGHPPTIDIEYMDEDVNTAERIVRREVFQHLTLNPKQDLTASLVLLSVVHDVERVGDYIKALVRVQSLLDFAAPQGAYNEEFARMGRDIRPLFDQTRVAYINGEPDLAREIVATHTRVREQARAILQKVIDDEFLDRRQTVLVTAGGRNLKRVSAHLANIASSVVHPFDKIGSKDEDL